jgi:hypothetical protein
LHFWPMALAFLHVHACPCLQVLRRLVRCLGPKSGSVSRPVSRQSFPRVARIAAKPAFL